MQTYSGKEIVEIEITDAYVKIQLVNGKTLEIYADDSVKLEMDEYFDV